MIGNNTVSHTLEIKKTIHYEVAPPYNSTGVKLFMNTHHQQTVH